MEDKFWKKLSQVVFELWGDCLVGIAGKSQYFKVCQRPWKNCFNGHPFPTVALYVISELGKGCVLSLKSSQTSLNATGAFDVRRHTEVELK